MHSGSTNEQMMLGMAAPATTDRRNAPLDRAGPLGTQLVERFRRVQWCIIQGPSPYGASADALLLVPLQPLAAMLTPA
jgi:hypothetical protein